MMVHGCQTTGTCTPEASQHPKVLPCSFRGYWLPPEPGTSRIWCQCLILEVGCRSNHEGCPFRPTQVMVLGIWHSSFCWRECHTPICWNQPLTIKSYENFIKHTKQRNPQPISTNLQAWPIRCGYLHHKTRAVLLPCHEPLTSAQVSDGFIMPWSIPCGKIVFANWDQHLMHEWNHHDVVNPIENIILNSATSQ